MIIGICGLIGSGKGTVADILVEEHGFKKLSFADSLKDGVAAMFDWPRHLLEGDTDKSREWRETSDSFWSQEIGKEVSPRLILQIVGTECMRNGLFDGIWVSLVKKKLKEDLTTNYVIPDTRFLNEIDMIRSLNGKIWRIKRGEEPDWVEPLIEHNIEPIDVHPSEFRWLRSNFDCIINNEGSIENLKNQILSHLS